MKKCGKIHLVLSQLQFEHFSAVVFCRNLEREKTHTFAYSLIHFVHLRAKIWWFPHFFIFRTKFYLVASRNSVVFRKKKKILFFVSIVSISHWNLYVICSVALLWVKHVNSFHFIWRQWNKKGVKRSFKHIVFFALFLRVCVRASFFSLFADIHVCMVEFHLHISYIHLLRVSFQFNCIFFFSHRYYTYQFSNVLYVTVLLTIYNTVRTDEQLRGLWYL